MKNITFALATILLFFSYSANSQYQLKKVTSSFGAGPATKKGTVGSIELQGVFKNNLVTSLSYHSATMDAKNEPADYQPGSIGLIIVAIPDGYERQLLSMFSGAVGILVPLDRSWWLTTEAGVSIVNGYDFTFTKQNVESDSWGNKNSNYKVTREKASAVGGILKADITWGFSSFAGIGLGVYTNLNSVQSVVGGEFKLVLGWMNRAKKPLGRQL